MITPFPYQRNAVDYMHAHDRAIIWAEQGSGKTIMILQHISESPPGLKLIVTKKNIISNAILKDNEEHYQIPIEYLGAEGTEMTKGTKLVPSTVYITNYEYLNARSKYFASIPWDTIYLDEAHAIRNRGSSVSQLFHVARPKLKYRRLYMLTGTLIPNKEEQAYPYIRAIEPLYWKDFSAMFFRQPIPALPYVFELIPDRKEAFWKFINRYIYKVTKEDTGLEWAAKNYIVYRYDLTPEQAFAHKSLLKYGVYQEVVIDYSIQTVLKLRQVVSGFININDNRYYEFPNDRTSTLDNIIRKLANRSHIIVFYNFDYDLASIVRCCERNKKQMYLFCGDITQKEKDGAIREWKQNGGVLAMNIMSGKNGLTLTESRDIVFYNLADNNEAYEQARDRIHRIGQTADEVTYHIICANGSVDEKIIDSLRRKANIQSELKAWINSLRRN